MGLLAFGVTSDKFNHNQGWRNQIIAAYHSLLSLFERRQYFTSIE
jgi:hypothetical protein